MTIQTLIGDIYTFINATLIPFILAIAFLVFIWKIVQFAIIGAANEADQEKARSQALWSIFAFVIILSLWGIVNLLVSSFGLGGQQMITPDYMQMKQTGTTPTPTSNTPSSPTPSTNPTPTVPSPIPTKPPIGPPGD